MAQTREDLQKKYGTTIAESYEIRPDIQANFSYSKEGKICSLSVTPKHSGLMFSQEKYNLLTELIDELVPTDKRGKNIINGFISAPGEGGSTYDYENLKITRWINKDGISVFIYWKDKSCDNDFPKEFIFST